MTIHQHPATPDLSTTPPDLGELVELIPDGDFPMAGGLDPYVLGASPTAYGRVGQYGQCDPYLPRTGDQVDSKLDAALELDQLVLLVGPSKAGKTRSMFEVVRRGLPKARVVVPLPGAIEQLAKHPRISDSSDSLVVWLDDLERFVAHDAPLTPNLLRRLLSRKGRTVVVATLRTTERDRMRVDAGELNREIRLLLEQSCEIPLDHSSTDETERSNAAALYPGERLTVHGIGEVLAGARELLQRYDDARDSDGVIQHAVIRTVIDWARVGRPEPIPEPLLAQLVPRVLLEIRPDLDVTDDDVAFAIVAARKPPAGVGRVAPILRTVTGDTRGYRPFDYLLAADDGQSRRPRSIPDFMWQIASQSTDSGTLLAVGITAYQRGNASASAQAFRRAADLGLPLAINNLGAISEQVGDAAEAEQYYRDAAATGLHLAMNNLASLLLRRGEADEAMRWFRSAADHGDHLAATALGGLAETRGDLSDAIAWYQRAAEGGYPPAINAIGALMDNAGDRHQAEKHFRQAASAGNLAAVANLALVYERRKELDTAEALYRTAAARGLVQAMSGLGNVMFEKRRFDEAEHWYTKAASAGDFVAMNNLGSMASKQGDRATSQSWYLKAANAGFVLAQENLACQLQSDGDLAGAKHWYSTAAAAGSPAAMNSLGGLAMEGSDSTSAEYWFRRGADGGNTHAMFNLARQLDNRGESEEATSWFVTAADAGHPESNLAVGMRLLQSGEHASAEAYLIAAVHAGLTLATSPLAMCYLLQQKFDSAENTLQPAASNGNAGAMHGLGILHQIRGEHAKAALWYRKATAAGYPE
ncbi:tetratricopeptide repeat protein [Nocardia asteroides]|uniref:tetratricopeptide repeat protein n=1 Tax=Nocardia asteroides TaxID=1824 RepID=UPI003446BF15